MTDEQQDTPQGPIADDGTNMENSGETTDNEVVTPGQADSGGEPSSEGSA